MCTVTVLTPTYNRIELLPRLYQSLLEQENKDFYWLIVDDGSVDGTSELVTSWMQDNQIPIQLVTQENGGKHRALNNGIKRIESEFTFIVDSDDYLPTDAIGTILAYAEKYGQAREKERLCGFSFLRCYESGEVNTAYFPIDEHIGTYRDVRINGHIGGDKAEVFYTDILKKYVFPEFEGEKFLPEDLIWMRMSRDYQMVHINKCIYISEYLDGGLTKSGRKNKKNSPKGMIERSIVYLEDREVNYVTCIKMMLLYVIYNKFAGNNFREMFRQSIRKMLFLILYIPGLIIYINWKREEV